MIKMPLPYVFTSPLYFGNSSFRFTSPFFVCYIHHLINGALMQYLYLLSFNLYEITFIIVQLCFLERPKFTYITR